MALPRVNTPTYELKIPSTGKKVKYRPFLVKEEKILLMALEEGTPKAMIKAMKDIISACTEDSVKLQDLAPFDMEYFFLQLRGKSVGDSIDLTLNKPLELICGDEDEDCREVCPVKINTDDVIVDTSNVKDSKIELTNKIGVKLNYPDFTTLQKITGVTEDNATADDVVKIVIDCIEYIWEEDEIYKAKDSTKAELIEFIESLSSSQFTKIKEFLDGMPTVRHTVKWECSKCNKSIPIVLEGIEAFFE